MNETFEQLKAEARTIARNNLVPNAAQIHRWGFELAGGANTWRDFPASSNQGQAFTDPGQIMPELRGLLAEVNNYYPFQVDAKALAMDLWSIHPLQRYNPHIARLLMVWAEVYFGVE